MRDLIIGVVSTLISTIIIGLWGTLMIVPYQEHMKIYKAILHLARNYEDPHKYEGQLIPTSLMTNCIGKQLEQIENIQNSILEQKDLSSLSCWIFKYEELVNQLGFLAEYTRNPIMLSEQKEFSDSYRLNQDTFFEELKELARFPKIKIALLFLIPTLILIIVVCAAVYFICPQIPMEQVASGIYKSGM